MYSYEFVEHTADIAAILQADNIQGLFYAGLNAWKDAVSEGTLPDGSILRTVKLKGGSNEDLLVKFIGELNFWLETERLLSQRMYGAQIEEKDGELEFSCSVLGSGIFATPEFSIGHEIKAVTYHGVEIKKESDVYSTLIVFDI